MQRALALALEAEGNTSPNPMVGCVIVDDEGSIVGEGYHHKAGEPHAEVNALAEAKHLARGATAYVTLEPCAHYGRVPAAWPWPERASKRWSWPARTLILR